MASHAPDTGARILSLLLAVLGQAEDSTAIKYLLSFLQEHRQGEFRITRKVYPDITYLNVHALGISFQLEPSASTTKEAERIVTAIDIYNHAPEAFETGAEIASKQQKKSDYGPFPTYPVPLATFRPSATSTPSSAPSPSGTLGIDPSTSGTDLVRALGEPSRKGGGEGPIGRGPAAWMEWTGVLQIQPSTASSSPTDAVPSSQLQSHIEHPGESGRATLDVPIQIMVELGGPGSRGPRRWEADSAGQSVWKVLTLSTPASSE
ncbi:hypothetical protein A4X13_0g6726 [Tilletia indica]|uniref:Uncharacterized protein n=1 Tax=Tilletia indica TaxID=43049 RepID=A0A177T7C2_9BASI|nr:hypothetical protein A4X13_0g6726 [Tilletia indica]